MNSVRLKNLILKYQRFTPSGWKEIRNRKFEFVVKNLSSTREGVQRRHDPRKNDLRTSRFAELPPGPAKLVSQPQ